MTDGIIRVAAAAPCGAVACSDENAIGHIAEARHASLEGARVLVFQELSLSGYAIGDLVTQSRLLIASENALARYCEETKTLNLISFVGVPVRVDGKVYSCAAAVCRGRVIGIVPKSIVSHGAVRGISAYRGESREIRYCGQVVPFGNKQLFVCESVPSLVIAVEIGEEMRAPVPPSSAHTVAGATLVVALGAEPEIIGAAARRRTLVEAHSARTLCAYAYAGAGEGESGTDGVYAGHTMVARLGQICHEGYPFGTGYAAADVDMEMVLFARSRSELFEATGAADYVVTPFDLICKEQSLASHIPQLPFVPANAMEMTERCETILNIQSCALGGRMERAYAKTLVFGISGGLDSTLALLVCVRAMNYIARDLTDIVAVTMPCFGTTARTRSNAQRLAEALGVTFREIDIKHAVEVHFDDIGHDPSDRSVVYENAQARERTQVLMDIANRTGGLVVGTGDLSELALGWATYNGDHMSMYGVNAGVPKTMMRYLVAYEAERFAEEGNAVAAEVLRDILATPVSPELLPPKDGEIAQCTENIVGPYELHDFFLYYTVRWGFTPHKILRYAIHAFDGVYDEETIRGWLTVFVRRFFAQQFKRSCLPDGPAVGTVSLSPRGAWNMPSDALSAAWIEDLK